VPQFLELRLYLKNYSTDLHGEESVLFTNSSYSHNILTFQLDWCIFSIPSSDRHHLCIHLCTYIFVWNRKIDSFVIPCRKTPKKFNPHPHRWPLVKIEIHLSLLEKVNAISPRLFSPTWLMLFMRYLCCIWQLICVLTNTIDAVVIGRIVNHRMPAMFNTNAWRNVRRFKFNVDYGLYGLR